MNTKDSYLHNCYVVTRLGDDLIFDATAEHGVQARLVGYLVIPIEDLDKASFDKLRLDCLAFHALNATKKSIHGQIVRVRTESSDVRA